MSIKSVNISIFFVNKYTFIGHTLNGDDILIPCAFDCVHQKDGVCYLNTISNVSCGDKKVCAYYKKKNLRTKSTQINKSIHTDFIRFANSANTDNLDL